MKIDFLSLFAQTHTIVNLKTCGAICFCPSKIKSNFFMHAKKEALNTLLQIHPSISPFTLILCLSHPSNSSLPFFLHSLHPSIPPSVSPSWSSELYGQTKSESPPHTHALLTGSL